MKKMEILEGSMAVALAVKACKPGVISAYPISPNTHIVEVHRLIIPGSSPHDRGHL
jgi:pyruvate ferredoxin oxidoreductase alpha subunit